MDRPLLRIALPVPVHGPFDYLPPSGASSADCRPGVRVLVPFGPRRLVGVVLDCPRETPVPEARLRRALRLLDDEPLLDAAHLAFLRRAAAYYHHPIGEVIAGALPVALRRGRPPRARGVEAARLRVPEARALEATARAPRQRALIERLLAAPRSVVPLDALCTDTGDREALRRLCRSGLVERVRRTEEAPLPRAEPGPAPNTAQRAAIEAVVAALGGFAAFLLDGVTGSGKTEVYLQVARRVLERGRTVLVLVPEIALTPQLARRFSARLGVPVTLLHSGLGEGEREAAWQAMRRGEARVVLGTRSAVLHPYDRLGLVVVDEEHDTSFKQQDGFRYSARDLAVLRARHADCPVILGSATPALETLHNARQGRYRHLRLPLRAGGARPPEVRLLDIRDQPLRDGLSDPLRREIGRTLEAGRQAMLFLNRRGFAPVLACGGCGWVSDCPRCDARQTLHRAQGRLCCHHCGSQRPAPERCPACGDERLYPLGAGTERVEQGLAAAFPGVPLIRIDRDATARKGSLERLLERVRAGGAALLVGTQMLAKGHHFPEVTLVGVLGVDGGLFSADFRGPERLAQLLVQVAGRAGRAEQPGRVLIQTRYPEHPLLRTLVGEGYEGFARAALRERAEAGWPPFGHQALVRAEANAEAAPERFLQALAAGLGEGADTAVALLGPAPAPMPRRQGRYRWHLLLQAARREALHAVLERLHPLAQALPEARRVRWSLDVDPVDLY